MVIIQNFSLIITESGKEFENKVKQSLSAHIGFEPM